MGRYRNHRTVSYKRGNLNITLEVSLQHWLMMAPLNYHLSNDTEER